jgi:hypothetical protein
MPNTRRSNIRRTKRRNTRRSNNRRVRRNTRRSRRVRSNTRRSRRVRSNTRRRNTRRRNKRGKADQLDMDMLDMDMLVEDIGGFDDTNVMLAQWGAQWRAFDEAKQKLAWMKITLTMAEDMSDSEKEKLIRDIAEMVGLRLQLE